MIDCEELTGDIPGDYADRLYKFSSKIQQEAGIKPIVYTRTDFAIQHLDKRFSVFPVAIQKFSQENKPELPDWWTSFLFWHYQLSIDDPEQVGIEKFVYNGNSEAFNHLSEQLKVSPNKSP